MKWLNTYSILTTAVLLSAGFAGCQQDTTDGPQNANPAPSVDAHDDHGHAHPTEGPHHGDLIELGNEEYHAELVHDETAGTVTIYVLDGGAVQQVPIKAAEVTINANRDGTPVQFQVPASPDESDPEGKSSRFVSSDQELAEHLDEEGADARLVLTINGKSYRGEIAHNHDHGHDHAHE